MSAQSKNRQNDKRCVKKIRLDLASGLHARPATILVKLALTFDAEIRIESNCFAANAKSILGVLSLGVTHGAKVLVTAEGHDAHAAVRNIVDLFARRFGEEETETANRYSIPASTSSSGSVANVVAESDIA